MYIQCINNVFYSTFSPFLQSSKHLSYAIFESIDLLPGGQSLSYWLSIIGSTGN